MSIKTGQHIVEGSMSNLLLDPGLACMPRSTWEDESIVSAQGVALEALSQAHRDPGSTVQGAVLQSLIRMRVSKASIGSPTIRAFAIAFLLTPLAIVGLPLAY